MTDFIKNQKNSLLLKPLILKWYCSTKTSLSGWPIESLVVHLNHHHHHHHHGKCVCWQGSSCHACEEVEVEPLVFLKKIFKYDERVFKRFWLTWLLMIYMITLQFLVSFLKRISPDLNTMILFTFFPSGLSSEWAGLWPLFSEARNIEKDCWYSRIA